jgi:hypothetical protein
VTRHGSEQEYPEYNLEVRSGDRWTLTDTAVWYQGPLRAALYFTHFCAGCSDACCMYCRHAFAFTKLEVFCRVPLQQPSAFPSQSATVYIWIFPWPRFEYTPSRCRLAGKRSSMYRLWGPSTWQARQVLSRTPWKPQGSRRACSRLRAAACSPMNAPTISALDGCSLCSPFQTCPSSAAVKDSAFA